MTARAAACAKATVDGQSISLNSVESLRLLNGMAATPSLL